MSDPKTELWGVEDADGLHVIVRGSEFDLDPIHAVVASLPTAILVALTVMVPDPRIQAILGVFTAMVGGTMLWIAWQRTRNAIETRLGIDGRGLLINGDRVSAGRIERAHIERQGWPSKALVIGLVEPREELRILASRHTDATLRWLVEQVTRAAGAATELEREAIAEAVDSWADRGGQSEEAQ